MSGNTPVLEARAISRAFGTGARRAVALDGCSLEVHPGRVVALIGASGSGKSTLLRVLAGLESVDAGEVRERGIVVSDPDRMTAAESRRVGLVFQDYALFPHLTAEANVAFGLARLSKAEARARASDWLERVGLSHKARAFPHQLSGGEQQRVALARALAPEPTAVLLDEPFSGLDPFLRADLQTRTLATLKAAGTAALIVSHDTEEALALADDVAVMAQGRILQSGPPHEVYDSPVSLTVARALGPVWSMRTIARDGRADTPAGMFDSARDGPCVVWARPGETAVTADPAGAFTVVSVRGVGRERVVLLAAGDQLIEAHCPALAIPEVGARARVHVDCARVEPNESSAPSL